MSGVGYWVTSGLSQLRRCLGSIPGLGTSPGEGNGYPLHYSGLEKSMDYTVLEITESRTQMSDFHFPLQFFLKL